MVPIVYNKGSDWSIVKRLFPYHSFEPVESVSSPLGGGNVCGTFEFSWEGTPWIVHDSTI
jgi:hypothetical protein